MTRICVRCGGENKTEEGNVCLACLTRKELQNTVIQYLISHPLANALDVARDTGVPVSIVIEMINAGHLRIQTKP